MEVVVVRVVEEVLDGVGRDVVLGGWVNEGILIRDLSGEVNERNVVMVVDGRVVGDNGGGGRRGEVVLVGRVIEGLEEMKGKGSLEYGVEWGGECNGRGGSERGEREWGSRRRERVDVRGIGERNSVKRVFGGMSEMGRRIEGG